MSMRRSFVQLHAPRSSGPLEWSMLAGLSLLWGGSFFFVEVAVATLPPLTLVALRVGLAAAALNLALLATGRTLPRDRSTWAAFLAMGLLNDALPFRLIAWAQTHVASGHAAILNATTPLFTVVVAHVGTRDERLSATRLGALAIGFAGVVVMVGADALGARTLALGAALLGERPAGHHGVGMGLIGLGLAAIDGRPLRALRAALARRAAPDAVKDAVPVERRGDR